METGKVDFTRWIVGLPLLITVFVPRSPAIANPFFVYGVIGGVVGFAFMALTVHRAGLDRNIFIFWGWLGLIALVTTCSQLLNTTELYVSGVSRIFRPFLYMVVIAYGYKVGIREETKDIYAALLWTASFILLGQVVVGFTQFIGMDVFRLIYTSEKASPFYEVLRITGTMGNPNTLGWVMVQVVAMITLLKRDMYPYMLVALCSIIVVFSGSRTATLILPFVLILTHAFRQGAQIRIGQLLMVGVVVLSGAVGLFLAISEYLPYIGQIRQIFLTGSLTAVESLQARFIHWEKVAEHFFQSEWSVWLFGLSDRAETQTLDNDYLYVLFRTGLAGLIIHLSFILYILRLCYHWRKSRVAQMCIVYVLSALLTGLVAETLAGWLIPIWLMYLFGILVGIEKTSKQSTGIANTQVIS
jgi:hypothetical protein